MSLTTPILYGIPNCDTVKRARAWLADRPYDVQFHDFKKQGVPAAHLDRWIAAEAQPSGSSATERPAPRSRADDKPHGKRLVVFFSPNGTVPAHWTPDGGETGDGGRRGDVVGDDRR